jgi:uncharacterized protein (DUF1800 family)
MNRLILGLLCLLIATSPVGAELPYERHGWSKQEAAAHLLARFTFGAQPGQLEQLTRTGLEPWLEEQLTTTFANQPLNARLAALPDAYRMTNEQMMAAYPMPPQLLAKTPKEGRELDRKAALRQAMQEQGARPIKELGTTLFAQKLYHARYSQAQVQEVMTEFWFNHFNVAASNNRARRFILSYERDALRPHALGSFRQLLGSTAKHPAMLWYLDNATSTASADAVTSLDGTANLRLRQRMEKRQKGLNENYARELLELHTLGVDGGYTQKDVTEAARILTGWTAVPFEREAQLKQYANRAAALGIVRQGDFLFAGSLHDAGAKTVLGTAFPAGQGLEEGERLLDLAAAHRSTARHLARKLAVRFVSDQPSEALVDRLSLVFTQTGGDIKAMLRAIARSDEFWQPGQRASKVKSPLELVVSAARILDADLQPTAQLYDWLVDMGQPLYNYQAPTGFPDRAETWVSAGTVLQRMNFGLEAAGGRVLGFSYEIFPADSLRAVVETMLPARNPQPMLDKLQPMIGQADSLAAERPKKPEGKGNLGGRLPGVDIRPMTVPAAQRETATMIGLVLGSPEFQRR